MEWLEVTIKTVSPAIELLADKLTAMGYDSFVVDDSNDFQHFLEENQQYWDYVDEDLAKKMQGVSQIRLYIPQDAQAPEQLSSLKHELAMFRSQNPDRDLGTLEIALENLQEEDWENNWKQYYQPIPVGRRLLIVPEWLSPENPDRRIPVKLDPGMIFGTGAHASTQMCLKALEENISGGERVIDLGSGSGILSIASLLLGAATAVGVDIDPKAEDIARENAAYNGFAAPAFTALTGSVTADKHLMQTLTGKSWDVVLVNIVADVIISLAPVLPRLMGQESTLICSGILDTRLNDVTAALTAAGLRITSVSAQEDWRCITAKK